MKELWKISYESYILLDMKSVMTSEENGLLGTTLRRKIWGSDAFFKGVSSWRGWLVLLQPELLTREVDKSEGQGSLSHLSLL